MKALRVTRAIAGSDRTVGGRRTAWVKTCAVETVVATVVAVAAVLSMASAAAATTTVRVQYLSNSSVYLDGGRGAGLVEGTVVRIERQGRLIAELVVDFVATNSASCTVRSSTEPIQAGDTCTFTPAPADAAADASSGAGAGAGSGSGAAAAAGNTAGAAGAARATNPIGAGDRDTGLWTRLSGVRGLVSTGYTETTDDQGRYANPVFRADLRWRGQAREELAVRGRADRPVLTDVATDGFSTPRPREVRIYEASARYRSAREKMELEAGRHFPSQLEAMGPIDGIALRWRPRNALRFGAAGGQYAHLPSAGVDSQGKRGGVFAEIADPRTQGIRRWRTVFAALRMDDTDVTRRQYVQWRTDASFGPRVRFFENLEVDVNPGWKQARGENRLAATRYSLTGEVDVHRRLGLTAGYDFARDPLLPEQRALTTVLTRERRRIAHGAARIGLAKHVSLRLASMVRLPAGEDGTLYNWDGSVIASNLGKTGLTLIAHGTRYDTRYGTGTIADGSMSWQVARPIRMEFGGGSTATEAFSLSDAATSTLRFSWLRTGIDIQPGHGVWVAASGEWRTQQSGREFNVELGRQF